jgi:photosystem II stability/assembly factor-like uncharacterized protein
MSMVSRSTASRICRRIFSAGRCSPRRFILRAITVSAMWLACSSASATPGWSWLTPTPTPYTLRHVAQLDEAVAVAVGDHRTLLSTRDGGTTWVSSEAPFVTSEGAFNVVRFIDDRRALAVGGYSLGSLHPPEGLIAQTADAGETWISSASFPGMFLLDVAVGTDGEASAVGIDAKTFDTIFLHTSDGSNWTTRPLGFVGLATTVRITDSATFVAGFNAITGTGTILRSEDGATWTETSAGDQILLRLAFRDAEHGIAIGLAGTAFTASDGGTSWQAASTGSALNLHDVSYAPDGTLRIAAGDEAQAGQLLVSADDGARWSTTSFDRDLEGVSFTASGNGMVVGFGGTVRTTVDNGLDWRDVATTIARQALFSVRFADAERGVAVGEGGAVITTDDGGRHWKPQSSVSTQQLYDVSYPTPDFMIAVGGDRLANTPAVIGSFDRGRAWVDLASFDFPTTVLESVDCTSTTTCTAVGRCGLIIRTEDSGRHWIEAQAADCNTLAWLRSIRFHDAMSGLAVGGNAILRTTDGGVTWSPATSPTLQPAFAVAYADDRHVSIAAGGEVGEGTFLSSDDGGASWRVQQDQFVDSPIGIVFADVRNGAAVGVFGSIFTTHDGGANWSIADATIEGTLYGIAPLSQGRLLAVGGLLGNATIRVYDDAIYTNGFDLGRP